MRKSTGITVLLALCLGMAFAQEKKEKMFVLKDLAPAVQKTIQAELKGGEIKNIGKETEDGVAQYEVETMVNGKHRDFNIDANGKLLLVEEEPSIDSMSRRCQGRHLKEGRRWKARNSGEFMRGGETMYEAAYTTRPARSTRSL
jgi:hypothetical protein